MNKWRSLLLILSFVIGQLQKSGILNYSKLQNNVSHNTNLCVQKLMNKLFTILKLKDTFKTRSETLKFLDFYETMRKIASNNWKVFEEMKYLTKISDHRSNNITLFKLNDLIRDIVRDEHHILLRKAKAVTLDSKQTNTEATEFKVLDEATINNGVQEIIEPGTDLPKPIRRIYNGEPATVAKYPFVVSVHVMGLFFCAGSIISKHHVITAASCIIIDGTSRNLNIHLRIGSDYAVKSGAVLPINTVHFHPEYDGYTLKNNLAILTTEKPFNFVNYTLKKIKYEKHLNENDANSLTNIRILGWGAKDKDSVFKINFGRLSLADLSVYDFEECIAIYSSNYVSEMNFCAGFVTKGGGACNGDVGGPGISNGILVGVVSYGAPVCGVADSPTVFTRLGHYEKWISNVTNEKSSSSITQSRKPRRPTKLKTTKKHSTRRTTKAYYSTKGIMNDVDDADSTDNTETVVKQKNETTRMFYKDLSGILREVIKEIALSHHTLDIDNYLYTDYNEENEDTFSPTTQFDFREDPMINFVNQLTTVFPTEDPDFAPMDKLPDYWDRQKTLTLPTALPRFLPTAPYFFLTPGVDYREAESRRWLRDKNYDINRRIKNILESSTTSPSRLKRHGLNANDYLAYFY